MADLDDAEPRHPDNHDQPREALAELHRRLDRYPASRAPVQHATTRFHLGTLHLQQGRVDEAIDELTQALSGFAADALPAERAKTMNMLGIAHREQGALDDAAQAFTAAADGFVAAGQASQAAAARFNLGLVARQQDRTGAAIPAFRSALEAFSAVQAHLQASAAGRELGACLLEEGEAATAVPVLEEALRQSDVAGEATAVGAAANILGLALLAVDRPADAAEAFRRAAGAHPRRLRPADHAMATANLALALAHDAPAAAAVAARQAAGVPAAPDVAVEQARAVLDRLGRDGIGTADVFAVLDASSPEGWAGTWRQEHQRLLDADAEVLTAETAAFVHEVLQRPDTAIAHVEAWIDAVLDLPPRPMEGLLASVLLAVRDLDAEQDETIRTVMARVLPRFPMPQWMRLKDTLDALATRLGEPGGWG